jgi:hypothetical protein
MSSAAVTLLRLRVYRVRQRHRRRSGAATLDRRLGRLGLGRERRGCCGEGCGVGVDFEPGFTLLHEGAGTLQVADELWGDGLWVTHLAAAWGEAA